MVGRDKDRSVQNRISRNDRPLRPQYIFGALCSQGRVGCCPNLCVAPPSWRLQCQLDAGVTAQIGSAPTVGTVARRTGTKCRECAKRWRGGSPQPKVGGQVVHQAVLTVRSCRRGIDGVHVIRWRGTYIKNQCAVGLL